MNECDTKRGLTGKMIYVYVNSIFISAIINWLDKSEVGRLIPWQVYKLSFHCAEFRHSSFCELLPSDSTKPALHSAATMVEQSVLLVLRSMLSGGANKGQNIARNKYNSK